MPGHRTGIAAGLLGVCFLVFYLVVRLLCMEQLDAAVAEANVHSIGDLTANLSGPILIWVMWGVFVQGGDVPRGHRWRP